MFTAVANISNEAHIFRCSFMPFSFRGN